VQAVAVLPPLVLTGAPGAGKTTTAARLAAGLARAAVIDVDDVRHMVISGHAAPWQGREGQAQQRLGVDNSCGLARRFAQHGVDVVIADVLTADTTALYRDLLPGCLIVRLHLTLHEAHRRAGMRTIDLTDEEFQSLHAQDRNQPPPANHHIEVTRMSLDQQVAAVAALWQP